MYLVLGDWSDDGHGKYEKILVETNQPVEKIQQAYKDSCKLTGISFNHNDDFTGIKQTVADFQGDYTKYFKSQRERLIGSEYENYTLNKYCYDKLTSFGINLKEIFEVDEENPEEVYIDTDSFPKLWFAFVKLSLPDLEYSIPVENDSTPVINGYWNKNLNVQFGYGLFS